MAGILFVVFLAVELVFFRSSRESGAPSSKRAVAIQVEVLNGTTEPNIAQRATEILRSGGFDVVDVGNAKTPGVAETRVIARTQDISPAQSVASYLGVDKKNVLLQPDRNLYLDVSVIIGKDIHQLRMFR
ncbi:MAG TPA: LytR C-terminal domain-containing protein [Bacteroidota bacterium]|nr:LytR C-terminal domain-containing protein [Bacteroidota bacterium]